MRYFVYNGGAPKYVARIGDVAARGYEGIDLGPGPTDALRHTADRAKAMGPEELSRVESVCYVAGGAG